MSGKFMYTWISRVRETVPQYPFELIFGFLSGIVVALLSNQLLDQSLWRSSNYMYLAIVASYIVNEWTREHDRPRAIYYVASVVSVLLLPLAGYYYQDADYCLVAFICSVLIYFLTGTDRSNATIVQRATKLAKSIFVSVSFLVIIMALLWLIILSVSHLLFDISTKTSAYFYAIVSSVSFVLLFTFYNRHTCDLKSNVFIVLVHYILTPALLIYTLILYVYIGKILFKTELPQGNLGYITIMYMSLLFMTRAVAGEMPRFAFTLFYRIAPWLSLAPLVLLWIGSVTRIMDYGLTVPRGYLLIVAVIETLIIALSFAGRLNRYAVVIYTSLVLLAAGTYVPYINVAAFAERSQAARPAEDISDLIGEKTEQLMFDVPVSVEGYRSAQMLYYPYESMQNGLTISLAGKSLSVERGEQKTKESLLAIYQDKLKNAGYPALDSLDAGQKQEFMTIKRDSFEIVFRSLSIDIAGDSIRDVRILDDILVLRK